VMLTSCFECFENYHAKVNYEGNINHILI